MAIIISSLYLSFSLERELTKERPTSEDYERVELRDFNCYYLLYHVESDLPRRPCVCEPEGC